MVGVGRTVFDGTRVEEFKVTSWACWKTSSARTANLILARLEGGPLAHTGVIAA